MLPFISRRADQLALFGLHAALGLPVQEPLLPLLQLLLLPLLLPLELLGFSSLLYLLFPAPIPGGRMGQGGMVLEVKEPTVMGYGGPGTLCGPGVLAQGSVEAPTACGEDPHSVQPRSMWHSAHMTCG